MEIRANYTLVGLFALLLLFGGIGFAMWTARPNNGIAMSEYDISLTESVRGLSLNSGVLFSGIPVGRVTKIMISDVTPGAVRVRISIRADTPVRADSYAQLAVTGLTGTSQITISGGTAASPLIGPPADEIGSIPYKPSPLSSFMTQAPDTLAAVNHILHRVEAMFSERNAESLSSLLSSLATIADVAAKRAQTIDNILASAETTSSNLEQLSAGLNATLLTDLRTTSESMRNIVKRIDSTLSVMEPGLKQFSTQGMGDMRMLTADLRNLVHVLTRVGQKLENDPRRFLFGEPVQEYRNR